MDAGDGVPPYFPDTGSCFHLAVSKDWKIRFLTREKIRNPGICVTAITFGNEILPNNTTGLYAQRNFQTFAS
jgi:hypothetical protein